MDEALERAGLEYVKAALRALHENAESRSLNDDEQTSWDEGVEYVRATEKALADLEARRAEIAKFAAVPQPSGDVANKDFNINLRTSAEKVFDHGSLRSDSGEELRERALTAVEKHLPRDAQDNARADATKLLEAERRDSDVIARHIIRTSAPEYVSAFKEYMENPQGGLPAILGNSSARTAMSLTAGNGGVLVPQFLDPTIVLTNAGAENPIRGIASTVQITVDQWDGVTSAGVTAEWLAEGTEAADATPTFVGPTISVHKEAAWLFGSYEVIMDSGFNEVGRLIADGFDRLEATAHISGTGSGQPYGLITRLSGTGPAVAGTSSTLPAASRNFAGTADVYALDNALSPRWRSGGASFVTSRYFANVIRANTDSVTNYWQDFGAGAPATLIGYPVYYASAMGAYPALGAVGSTAITSGSTDNVLLLGDVSQYKIVDRIGTEIMYEPLVIGANQRPTGQAGWFAFKRTGADVLTSNAFKVLQL